MILVDGKKIAEEISVLVALQVKELKTPPTMVVIACNPNFETQKYLELKKAKATKLGIEVEVIVLPENTNTQEVITCVSRSVESASGIIVQLPLPKHIDTDAVLNSIPASHDVDAFSYQGKQDAVLPPVVGAIDEISKKYQIEWQDKRVFIFGSGRLVGGPAMVYARNRGAKVSLITEATEEVNELTKAADIIILGVGKPNLLTAEMVKEGVVVFDAGASEDGGLLVGDANLEVAKKASVFTPVPGGIGPVTISLLFQNLLKLHLSQ